MRISVKNLQRSSICMYNIYIRSRRVYIYIYVRVVGGGGGVLGSRTLHDLFVAIHDATDGWHSI